MTFELPGAPPSSADHRNIPQACGRRAEGGLFMFGQVWCWHSAAGRRILHYSWNGVLAWRHSSARTDRNMRTILLPVVGFALLSWTCAGQAAKSAVRGEAGKVTAHSGGLHGYIGFSGTHPAARSEFIAGMGFYSAVWPLIDQPLANFQIGLASAWITPDNSDDKDKPLAPEGTLARKWSCPSGLIAFPAW